MIFIASSQKLHSILLRMIFNYPDLNLRAEYILFDHQAGRSFCVGNGETCQRLTNQGVEQHPCPSPDSYHLAQWGYCKPYGRLHLNLDESHEFGTFIFRMTDFNKEFGSSIKHYYAVSKSLILFSPLQLILLGKSTRLI